MDPLPSVNRACLDCGIIILPTKLRCIRHQREWDRKRMAKRGALYDRAHRNRAHAVIGEQPWCTLCGAEDDLVADHVLPGDPDSPLRTLCRSCNSAIANRARRG